MKWGLALALLLVFELITGNSNAADVRDTSEKSLCILTIQGEIDNNTPTQLTSRYKSLRNGKPEQCKKIFLEIDSNGGNVEAAMNVGNFLRQKKITTIISRDASCASACVLVFIGGVNRLCAGNIGLHRPFIDTLSTSESMAKGRYEKTNSLIRQYLNRMNIPEALLDAMNAVPPGNIEWLNGEQLKKLHITGEDPVNADESDSLAAKTLGISKKEYYSREQRVRAICGDDNPSNADAVQRYIKCYEDVMNGRR